MTEYAKEIIEYKKTVMTRILSSKEIADSLPDGNSEENHIFPYGYMPAASDTPKCLITFEVSVPETETANHFLRDVILDITVICHRDLMQMNESYAGAMRTDYISSELNKLFNNQKGIGFGEITLISDTEETVDMYTSRTLSFRISAAGRRLR